MTDDKLALYRDWKKLINMSASEIQKFLDSEEGQVAGLSRKEASTAGSSGNKIKSGRDSARAIIRMLETKKEDWTENDWAWAKRQVAFIKRMSGANGPLEKDGEKTRKTLALMVWGHNPLKENVDLKILSNIEDFEMTFEDELELFEAEQETESKRKLVPSDREIFWVKFCRVNNMTASELQKFINSEEGRESGWSEDEQKKESGGAAVRGIDIAKDLVKILSKYSSHISKETLPENITDSEMETVTLAQKFVYRFIETPGPLKDADGELTPKAKALMLRSYNPIKAHERIPGSTQEIKKELKDKLNEAYRIADWLLN